MKQSAAEIADHAGAEEPQRTVGQCGGQRLDRDERQQPDQQVGEGGEVWIDALNGYCIANVLQRMLRWLHGKSMHLRYESPRRLKGLMIEAGLSEVRIHWIPILPAGLKALQPAMDGRLFGLLLRYVPGLGMFFSHSCLLRGVKR